MFKAKSLMSFFMLTFVFTLPTYVLVALASKNILFPPEMAFVFISFAALAPIAAALVMRFKESGLAGAKELLARSFDLKRIAEKKWYAPTLLLLPFLFIAALEFLFLLTGQPFPSAQFPITALPMLIPIFFIMALGEEVGWMGYAFGPMEEKKNAFAAALALGAIWALWHLPFYIYMIKDPIFIAAQVLGLVGLRVILVWIFNNAGKSVFAVILFHMVYNVTNSVLPNSLVSAPLGVIVTNGFILAMAVIVVMLWGTETMTVFKGKIGK